MDQEKAEQKNSRTWQTRHLVLALVIAAVVAVIMGTVAWLSYERSLLTITRMQMPILYLRDQEDVDTSAIDVGSLDFSEAGSVSRVFGVYATEDTQYILQLAYTTNLPLKCTLYKAQKAGVLTPGQSVDGYQYDPDSPLEVHQLANAVTRPATYGSYAPVQYNADPIYWQTDAPRSIERKQTQYYVLKISWDAPLENNKESDMIYVTVANALNTDITETTGGTG